MGGRRDDQAATRRPPATLVAGFVLAVVATLAVFLTDNPAYLRLAVIAAAAAFVLAAMAVGRRGTDQTAAAAREAELRRAFEHELDREEAAHREVELRLENDLRREAEESLRYELDGLRREIAALSSMRGDVRGISVLREQLAALPALRDEVARMSELRGEVAALNALRDDVEALAELREEFGRLGELRAEFDRLRTDITEQLSSELLIERIVMRTQATWGGGPPPPEQRPADEPDRTSESPRELTGGWPASRLDELLGGTRDYERVPAEPATSALDYLAPSARPADPEPLTPLDWLASRSLIDAATDLAHHSRHSAEPDDGALPPTAEVTAITADRPRPQPFPRYDRSLPPHDYARRPADDSVVTDPMLRRTRPSAPPAPPAPVVHEPAPTGPVYVSEILAEQGTPPPGGRRRRRYRDENTEDDVLSRVLGRD